MLPERLLPANKIRVLAFFSKFKPHPTGLATTIHKIFETNSSFHVK